jgi:hypothetical protein
MKIVKNTTPRPWKVIFNAPTAVIPGHLIKQDDDVQRPVALIWEGGGTHGKPIQKANAALIVKAVNEYDALIAVAEAAEAFRKFYFDDLAKSNKGFLSKLVLQDYQAMMKCSIDLPRALSNLAALQLLTFQTRLK